MNRPEGARADAKGPNEEERGEAAPTKFSRRGAAQTLALWRLREAKPMPSRLCCSPVYLFSWKIPESVMRPDWSRSWKV
jgi:hypothetical protein